MNYIKRRVTDFISDTWQWSSCIANVLLVICFAYFYKDSNYRLEPLYYGIFFLSYVFIVLFTGRKGILVMWMFFCYFAVQDITFINCTLFIVILALSKLWPKFRIPMIVLYALDVFVVCHRHNKTVYHLLAHFVLCFVFYWLFILVENFIKMQAYKEITSNYKKLDLTEDEEAVISELAAGKMMKEIKGFSKNTKSSHLKTALARNNMSKPELLAMYSIQNNIKQSQSQSK